MGRRKKDLKEKQNEERREKERYLESIQNKIQEMDLKSSITKKLFIENPKIETKLPMDTIDIIISFLKPENMIKLNMVCKYFCKKYYDLIEKEQKDFIKKFQLPKSFSLNYQSSMEGMTDRRVSFSLKSDLILKISFTDSREKLSLSSNPSEIKKYIKDFRLMFLYQEEEEYFKYLKIIDEILKENSYYFLKNDWNGKTSSTDFYLCNFNQSICFLIEIRDKYY